MSGESKNALHFCYCPIKTENKQDILSINAIVAGDTKIMKQFSSFREICSQINWQKEFDEHICSNKSQENENRETIQRFQKNMFTNPLAK